MFFLLITSVESQKGVIAAQRYFVENQKGVYRCKNIVDLQ